MLKKYLREELELYGGNFASGFLSRYIKDIENFLEEEGFDVNVLKNIGYGAEGDVFIETKSPKGSERVVKIFQTPNDKQYLFFKFDRLIRSNLKNVVNYHKLIHKSYKKIDLCVLTMEKLDKPPVLKILDSLDLTDEFVDRVERFFNADHEEDIEMRLDWAIDIFEEYNNKEILKAIHDLANSAQELFKLRVPFRDFHRGNFMYDPNTKQYKLIDIL